MIYLVCSILFWIGALGITVSAFIGGLHIGHAGSHGAIGHAGHTAPGHGTVGHTDAGSALSVPGHGGVGHAGHQGHSVRSSHGRSEFRGSSLLLTMLSPLTIFSFCLGAGATGMLIREFHFAATLVALIALAGGVVFFGAIVRPIFSFLLKFASKPSEALEGTLAHQAEAITSFDDTGKGLVQLTVDGQLVRILATLESDDRANSEDISPGDQLTVTSVDGHNNTCRVARF